MKSASVKLTTIAASGLFLLLAFVAVLRVNSQAPDQAQHQAITLDPPAGLDLQADTIDAKGQPLPPSPADFRRLGEARVGEAADLHTLTLRFSETTKITSISVTSDFKIEQGGSCVTGNSYEPGTTCRLLMRFTPQGPGNRLGHLTIQHSASPTPAAFGIGGYGYAPALSFIPSIITTVPGTYPLSKGLLSGAQNLTVDGGDTLWVSDTGNGLVRNIDSSGTFKTYASGYTGVLGIAVDTFGEAYFDVPSTGKMYEIYDYGPVVQVSGSGSNSCPEATPCTLSSEALGTPGEMSIDSYNHLFFVDSHQGAAFSTVQPLPANLIFLYDPFPYQTNPSSAMAVDESDYLYSLWANGGTCEIVQSSLYNAENSLVAFNKVAGGHTCGFSGDGGEAGNSEIGGAIGQIFFDAAGNLYFSDTRNQRVRRIDFNSGIIRTIAGDGFAGYTGDGGPATMATLNAPTGVAVDSQGQVYIISSAATGQVVRKIGTEGEIYFGAQPKGTPSLAHTIIVSNTGNSTMVLTNAVITGFSAADFKIDPATTSCFLTSGSTLYAGASCQIGVFFTPIAGGAVTATLTLLDNTVTNTNTILLEGTGTLPSASFTITSPVNGSSYSSSASIPFSVTVKAASGPAPTGTVQFKVDGVAHGSPVTLASGAASITLTGLSAASHTLSATYSGDANYATGGPVSVTITVTAAAVKPAVSLKSAPTPAKSCSETSFDVGVTNTTRETPTGEVLLMDGTKVLSTGTLKSGIAVLSSGILAKGTHSLSAHYRGDTHNLPAVSPALVEQITTAGACGQLKSGNPLVPAAE